MQLKELDEHALITRNVFLVVPPKVEYSLTDFGKSLLPVLSTLGAWADEHEDRLREVILKRLEK